MLASHVRSDRANAATEHARLPLEYAEYFLRDVSEPPSKRHAVDGPPKDLGDGHEPWLNTIPN